MTKQTTEDLIRQAERILNDWLVDNTEEVFEEQPEIDTVRGLLLDALDLIKPPTRSTP